MGGTSERKPPERNQAHRHLHAVPPADQDKETGAAAPDPGSGTDDTAVPAPGGATVPGAGTGAGSAAGPEPSPAPPAGAAPGTASDGNAPPSAQPAGNAQAANGTSPPAGQPATPSGTPPTADRPSGTLPGGLGAPSAFWTTGRGHILAAISLYGVLLIFGVLLGLTGSFQFSRSLGPVPVGAVFFAVLVGAACWFCGRAAQSVAGALVPAMGWIIASYSMAMPNTSGSVVVTNSIAGEIYLYGGALCAAIGVGSAFGSWTRAQQAKISARSAAPRRPRP